MNRLAALSLSLALTACHGVKPTPTAPDPPAQTTPIAVTRLAVVPSPGQLPIGGGTAKVFIELTGNGGIPVGVPVTLSASVGSLESTTVLTDNTGHASVTWRDVTQTGTVTAHAADLTVSQTLPVQTVPVFPEPPPPTRPDSPAPTPPSTPLPPVEAPPVVTLTPASPNVPSGTAQNYAAAVTGLKAGETILYYEWNFSGAAAPDATTIVATRSHTYTSHGVKRQVVTITTSQGRVASGQSSVVVTSPLR